MQFGKKETAKRHLHSCPSFKEDQRYLKILNSAVCVLSIIPLSMHSLSYVTVIGLKKK